MKKKVIAAGHICLDVTPVFPDKKVGQLGDLLQPGKLIHMEGANVSTGGSVANTGLGMKILGADVSLMGKIGDDAFGKMAESIFAGYGAQEGLLVAPGESTSYSVVLAVPGIDRIFLHDPGANDTFCMDDIPKEELREAALFHFGYPPLMKKMYEDDGEELLRIFQSVKAAGVATSLDFASIDPASEAGAADWEKILKRVLPYVDFFVPSVEELCFMLDRGRFTEWQERAGGRDITEILDVGKDVRPLAEKCMSFGAKVLLIKCGAPGMYYRTAGADSLQKISGRMELDVDVWADKEGFEKSYVPERVLSGTGAGDTSIAAFLTAVLEGCGPEECMQLATATGACCVAAYDALGGLKSFDELREKITAGWPKTESNLVSPSVAKDEPSARLFFEISETESRA